MVALSSWGRLGRWDHRLRVLADRGGVPAALRGSGPGIAYGMGRSYGDVCLNPSGTAWLTTSLDRFIDFDAALGTVRCEAGVTLCELQRVALARGWMVPVTPGTQHITVGGAVANDVHGKNHHRMGSFGHHVLALRLVRTDGEVIDCGRHERPDWFEATVAGAGLTGVIVEVTLQLRPVRGPWLDTETLPYDSLEAFFALADGSERDWEYTVSWIDCVAGGRGIFLRANHADDATAPPPPKPARAVPVVLPFSLVNRWSLRCLNPLYYHRQTARAGRARQHYQPFFYPLDHLRDWNRLYGPRGFFQYQSVVPRAVAADATRTMLDAIARAGEGSFLAVLKTFGAQPAAGLLSFPMPGATLALDFPNHGARTQRLFERLDAIVAEAGGRLYLAKDARMPRALFEAGYPRWPTLQRYRDPGISSALSRRLMGA